MNPLNQLQDIGIVGAADGEPVKRDVLDEVEKSLVQRLLRSPVFHMLRIDIRNHRDCRGKATEGTVALVSLDNHPLTQPHPGVAAVGMDNASVDNRRVEPAGVE